MKINLKQLTTIAGILCFLLIPSIGLSQSVSYYLFKPDSIYIVKTGLGIVTQIEISPEETIKDYSSGLSSGWDIVRRDNIFYVKPKAENVETNMTIRTETHSYQFELKVVSTDWDNLSQARKQGVQYHIKFHYPQHIYFSKTKNNDKEKIANSSLSTTLSGHQFYFTKYDYASNNNSLWLVPEKVYDDGSFTYIFLKKNRSYLSGNMPTVFARKSRKKTTEMIVNTQIHDNIIIVDGVYPFLVIRHGTDVVGIRKKIN